MSNEIPEIVRSSFEKVPIVDKNGYRYFVHPLSDGIRAITPELLKEMSEMVIKAMDDLERPSLLLTAEAMGIPVTTMVSDATGLSYSIARKRSYELDGEVEIGQRTGYSSQSLFLNLPEYSERILIIDDVLSKGGTLKALAEGVKESGKEVIGAIILFNKMGERKAQFSSDMGFPILTILDVEVGGEGCTIQRSRN